MRQKRKRQMNLFHGSFKNDIGKELKGMSQILVWAGTHNLGGGFKQFAIEIFQKGQSVKNKTTGRNTLNYLKNCVLPPINPLHLLLLGSWTKN
jgi:hypothetical protein